MRKLVKCFILLLLISSSIYSEDKPKLYVLILSSDQFPVYAGLQKIWKSYMHFDPSSVESYFIKADPTLAEQITIEGDVIWTRTPEGWPPKSAGIINKTLLAMEAILPKLKDGDFVLRTNLSSFYNFPQLLQNLPSLPTRNCWFASPMGNEGTIASGCGYILSRDVIELIVRNKSQMYGIAGSDDDVVVGTFLAQNHIPLIRHDRIDVLNIDTWPMIKDKIQVNAPFQENVRLPCNILDDHMIDRLPILPRNIFHFRVKCLFDRREVDDLIIQSELVEMIYAHRNGEG